MTNLQSNPTVLTQASREWAIRPADERFTSLTDLADAMYRSRASSNGRVVSSRSLEVVPDAANPITGLAIVGKGGVPFLPSNWSFGQLAERVKAPAGYLRTLPAPIAADALNYGLKFARDVEDVGVLLRQNKAEDGSVVSRHLMAATGPNYGRIWNSEIADLLVERFGNGIDGDWRVPGEFGRKIDVTKANTTLFASDRDMFVFLADEVNRVTIANRRDGKAGSLARGFFLRNSEVGASTLTLGMFLFDYACSNRMVWGAEGFKEIRIRHTAGAPDRFIEDCMPAINEMRHASAKTIEGTLAAAQATKIVDRAASLEAFLASRKFSKANIAGMIHAHSEEEGRPIETVWDAVTAATAYAKTIKHTDARFQIEALGGSMLNLVEA